jgi:meiosis-specific protein HOP1
VEYFLSADGKRATSFNLQKNNEQAAKVTLRTVKQSLNNFTVALTELCAALPELPEDRYMTLDIGYTDDRPPEYFAPGFTHSVRDSVRFPSNDDWEKKTTYVATAYTGRHAIGLQATHLLARDSNLEDALPSALGCTLESSMQDGVTADMSKKAMALVKPHPNSKAARRTDLSPSPLEDYALSEPHTIRSRIHSGALGRTSTKDRHEQQQIRDMVSSIIQKLIIMLIRI